MDEEFARGRGGAHHLTITTWCSNRQPPRWCGDVGHPAAGPL